MFVLPALFFLLNSILEARGHNTTDIKVGVILNDVPFVLDYLHFKPSIDIAFDEIRKGINRGDYFNFSLSYLFRVTDSTCGAPTMKAPGIASDIYRDHNVSAFFGPLCSGETEPVADLCAHWNIPVVSGASTSGILDNKARFQTFTRASYKVSNLVDFMVAIFRKYDWKTCSIIWDDTQAYWRTVLTPSLLDTLGNDDVTIGDFEMNLFERNITNIMEAATEKGRSKIH